MESQNKHLRPKRWGVAWGLSIVVHALIFGGISWLLRPDLSVAVLAMIPSPDEVVELYPAQALVPAVFFARQPDVLDGRSASLYRIDADGRRLISSGRLHESRAHALQFDAITEEGTYEIVVGTSIVESPRYFDGEYLGKLPSGDGKPGGEYRARFRIEHKQREIFTAEVYDPAKPQVNQESAASAKSERLKSPSLPPPRPKKKLKPSEKPASELPAKVSPQPEKTPQSEQIAEAVAPAAPTKPAQKGTILTPQNLTVGPLNLAPSLMRQSAQLARETFESRDVNAFVREANIAKSRYEAAYNPDGPVIKQGEQGNSLAHQKDVAEYLALMHKEIHRLWAHDYLLRLDTVFRRPGSRLNNPDLEAVAEITLNARGEVVDVRMVKSSGITEYDNEAIHVAWNSSPKVPIPDEMRSNNGKGYIHWTFWRDARQCGVFGVKVFKYEGSKRDALDFSLKAVQVQEKKLGLTPSALPYGIEPDRTEDKASGGAEEKPTDFETINPLED